MEVPKIVDLQHEREVNARLRRMLDELTGIKVEMQKRRLQEQSKDQDKDSGPDLRQR